MGKLTSSTWRLLWAKKLLRSITFLGGLFYFRVMTATRGSRVYEDTVTREHTYMDASRNGVDVEVQLETSRWVVKPRYWTLCYRYVLTLTL